MSHCDWIMVTLLIDHSTINTAILKSIPLTLKYIQVQQER